MADLKTFSRRIREIARQVEDGANETVIRVAATINQTVVLATPVLTGRARANWQAAIGSPVTLANSDEDPSGSSTVSRNNVVINTRRSGQVVYLSNNVDYIEDLNNGTSSQAPAGFVEEAVAIGVAAVRASKVLR